MSHQQEGSEMTVKNDTRERDRALQRQTPASTLSPWEELDRWFGGFGRGGGLHPFGRDWLQFPETMAPFSGKLPKVDLLDREHEIVVRAELPGVSKDDVEVTVEEFSVTIKATTKQEHEEEEGEYYHREMSSGEYHRTLALPAAVDEEKAQASFTDGVLELTVPKQEKTRRKSVKVD